jgi:DNA-binding response OmpR family regulator
MNLHPAAHRHTTDATAVTGKMMSAGIARPEPSDSDEPSDRLSILVVDDDETFCSIMAEILRMYRARVFTALSAEAAMEIMEQVTPDLILTDVMMPEVDGLTLVRRIRSGEAPARIPIIIVSAGVSHREQAAAMQAGADQFLPKPFSITELREAVGSLLPN